MNGCIARVTDDEDSITSTRQVRDVSVGATRIFAASPESIAASVAIKELRADDEKWRVNLTTAIISCSKSFQPLSILDSVKDLAFISYMSFYIRLPSLESAEPKAKLFLSRVDFSTAVGEMISDFKKFKPLGRTS
jgi:hypothetical protein